MKGQVIPKFLPSLLILFFANQLFCQNVKSISQEYTVVIDASHGGMDTGSTSKDTKILEKEFNLQIAKSITKKANENIKIILSRDKDVFLKKEERRLIADESSADLLLVIHIGTTEFEDDRCSILFNEFVDQKLVDLVTDQMKAVDRCESIEIMERDDLLIFKDFSRPGIVLQFEDMYDGESIKYLQNPSGIEEIAKIIAESLNIYYGR